MEALGPGWLFFPATRTTEEACCSRRVKWRGARGTAGSLATAAGGVPSAGPLPVATPAHAPAPLGAHSPRASQPLPSSTTTAARAAHSRAPWLHGRPAGHAYCHPRVHLCPRSTLRVPAQRPGHPPSRQARSPAPPRRDLPGTRAPPPPQPLPAPLPAAPVSRPAVPQLTGSRCAQPQSPTHGQRPPRPLPAAALRTRAAARCLPPARLLGAARLALAAGPVAARRGVPSRQQGEAQGGQGEGWGCGSPCRAVPFPFPPEASHTRGVPAHQASPLLQASGSRPHVLTCIQNPQL